MPRCSLIPTERRTRGRLNKSLIFFFFFFPPCGCFHSISSVVPLDAITQGFRSCQTVPGGWLTTRGCKHFSHVEKGGEKKERNLPPLCVQSNMTHLAVQAAVTLSLPSPLTQRSKHVLAISEWIIQWSTIYLIHLSSLLTEWCWDNLNFPPSFELLSWTSPFLLNPGFMTDTLLWEFSA